MATNVNPPITTPTRSVSLPKLNWKRGFNRLACLLYLPAAATIGFELDTLYPNRIEWRIWTAAVIAPFLVYGLIRLVVFALRWVARGFKGGQP